MSHDHEVRIADLERDVIRMRREIENLYSKITAPVKADEPFFEKDDFVIMLSEVKPYLNDYDTKHIRVVCNVIVSHFQQHYEYLPFALKEWLRRDLSRPPQENQILLNNLLPPVAEQIRLFPTKAPKDMDYFAKIKNVQNISDLEEQWRKEQAEVKKDPEINPPVYQKVKKNSSFRENYSELKKNSQKNG